MKTISRVTGQVVTSVMLGGGVLFLGLVAAVAVAFVTRARVLLPGVFEAWFTRENGLPALNFIPNGVGMLVVIAAAALIALGWSSRLGGRSSAS